MLRGKEHQLSDLEQVVLQEERNKNTESLLYAYRIEDVSLVICLNMDDCVGDILLFLHEICCSLICLMLHKYIVNAAQDYLAAEQFWNEVVLFQNFSDMLVYDFVKGFTRMLDEVGYCPVMEGTDAITMQKPVQVFFNIPESHTSGELDGVLLNTPA